MYSMPGTRKKLKTVWITTLIINLLALFIGIAYLLSGIRSVFWNLYGIFIFAALAINIYVAYIEDPRKMRGYFYFIYSGLCMLLIPVLNSIASFTPAHYDSISKVSCALFLSLFAYGIMLSLSRLISRKTEAEILLDDFELIRYRKEDRNRSLKTVLIILLSLVLALGCAVAYKILAIHVEFWILEAFIPSVSLFYAFVFLNTGVLIVKLLPDKKSLALKIVYSAVTLTVFVICLLPFASAPFMAGTAKMEYISAFGEDYLTSSDYNFDQFRKYRFSIPEYFFGMETKGVAVSTDIPFYTGKGSADEGLQLYFDAYTPADDGDMLPGGYSVLVRIHGGGWTSGDKGFLNNAQVNRYFASQGYVVFDIQYGLNDIKGISKYAEEQYGDYTVDDMVRHIGIFLDYLAKHADEYKANIDSVFISGGSAGGNLALATGLTLSDGKYGDFPGRRVKIKGIIPFYPANKLADSFGIGASLEFIDPGLIVSESSPPCLIFQGTHDGLVKYPVTLEFKNKYIAAGNPKCAVISAPFGGHACDMYFPGYYNQLFLYYMERFMYQFR